MWDRSNTTGTKMEFEDYKKLLNHVFQTAPIGLCLFDKDLRYRHIIEWLASTIINLWYYLVAGKHKLILESIKPSSERTHNIAVDVHVTNASLNLVRR